MDVVTARLSEYREPRQSLDTLGVQDPRLARQGARLVRAAHLRLPQDTRRRSEAELRGRARGPV
eukprot:5849646-Prymnesium_polylepis.1